MNETLEVILSALIYSTVATFVSQGIGVLVMWWLGLKPKKLVHEIEVAQNVAIGASFFIIALTTSIFIGVLTADPAPAESLLASYAWIIGGLALATLYAVVAFWAAHRALKPMEGENVYGWVQRELVTEQNASLAFFLGGLLVAPYIAVVSQIV